MSNERKPGTLTLSTNLSAADIEAGALKSGVGKTVARPPKPAATRRFQDKMSGQASAGAARDRVFSAAEAQLREEMAKLSEADQARADLRAAHEQDGVGNVQTALDTPDRDDDKLR